MPDTMALRETHLMGSQNIKTPYLVAAMDIARANLTSGRIFKVKKNPDIVAQITRAIKGISAMQRTMILSIERMCLTIFCGLNLASKKPDHMRSQRLTGVANR
jgi:hypothetical protein